ncbi:MAG: hypothetical protein GY794_21480, partial [bacterium]|nr:hypothetical protein [bacterium]
MTSTRFSVLSMVVMEMCLKGDGEIVFARGTLRVYTLRMSFSDAELTTAVCDLAIEVGFSRVGVAPAGDLGCSEKFDQWLERGWHGDMEYMERNVAKRK